MRRALTSGRPPGGFSPAANTSPLLPLLGEEPVPEFLLLERRGPTVVPNAGILAILRRPAGLLQRLDHLPRASHRHRGVLVPVECPEGDVRDVLRLTQV